MSKSTPGPWRVGYLTGSIVCENARIGGEAKLFDVRGWGYLTGLGHGALGLSVDEAKAIQDANAALCAAAPEMLAALLLCQEAIWHLPTTGTDAMGQAQNAVRAAISKAEGPRS